MAKKNTLPSTLSGNPVREFEHRIRSKGLTTEVIKGFQKIIYQHYREHGRSFAWRKTCNPYHILVSEIMLQQTQVDRVVKKYEEFIAVFPDFSALARAPLRTILKVWQGLGYNRRALALKKIAQIVVTEYRGKLPHNVDELLKLPGIGKTTASEIAAFAFNQPAVFIETNIRSVFIHFFFRTQNSISDDELLPLVGKTLDASNSRKWYYALMDYGATLKKLYYNPSRKSLHYRTQSPFDGSHRQIRGMILKVLTAKQSSSEKELVGVLQKPSGRVKSCLIALEKEGLVYKRGRRYAIA